MRKKEHSGSAAVIGAQLVILFILTVSLCVQSRKAAAENTYAVMEKSGEGSRAGEPEKACTRWDSKEKSGTAGNASGMYSCVVPSMRTAPVGRIRVPGTKCGCMPPQVPMRRNVSAPHCTSSSIAMAADGPPIPVEVTLTGTPSKNPVYVVNSRFCAVSCACSR